MTVNQVKMSSICTNNIPTTLFVNLSSGFSNKYACKNIVWNAQGKVSEIRRIKKENQTKSDLLFKYDAMGNRISKTEIKPSGEVGPHGEKEITTYYVHDAQGNVMAVYEKRYMPDGKEEFRMEEQHLYGSSRLGMRQTSLLLASTSWQLKTISVGGITMPVLGLYPDDIDIDLSKSERALGEKNYEMTNHLGNVLAVVSDKKLYSNNVYLADVKSVSDYYPFGMIMPGKTSYDPGNEYRYGFNQAEKVNEIAGEGNTYDLGSRLYNPRLGRPLTIDPRASEYAWQSSYAYYMNSPIWQIDYKGEGKTDNPNIQAAEQKAGDMNSRYNLEGNDRFTVERYKGENGLEGAKINHPDGTMIADFPGTPENQGSKISNAFHWLANYAVTEGTNDPANEGAPPPDMVGIQASANGIVGGGGNVSATVGYVRTDGFFLNVATAPAVGVDVSVSVSGVAAYYRGTGNPTSGSLSGGSSYQNVGAAFLTVGSFQNIYKDKDGSTTFGNIWLGGSVGLSFGSKTLYGGSAGISVTSPPLLKSK